MFTLIRKFLITQCMFDQKNKITQCMQWDPNS